ncbi:membrane protein [Allostella sp. ATCC 35155]|nr:membrane protein [Stella sp. ATCC 35155]
MIDLSNLTTVHTAISVIAIVAGFLLLPALLRGQVMPLWTGIFLWTAIATSATGFLFPFNGFLPSHGVGILALAALVPTVAALRPFRLVGPWHRVYAAGAVVNLYLLVFVLVAQAFQKVPALHALAPTGSEPAFAAVQSLVLVVFAVLGWRAVRAVREPAIRPLRV